MSFQYMMRTVAIALSALAGELYEIGGCESIGKEASRTKTHRTGPGAGVIESAR
jgi:hypothetical protein